MSNHPINRQVKMGLSPETIYIMKSTAPVLQEHGLEITKRLYELMFDRHSYVKNYFNRSHIFPPGGGVSTQAQAQANAIFAYASYCDDLEKLNEAVAIISHKHVSFNIPAEYYEDIGMDLIQAIKDVLGKDATEPIVKAWEEGYDFLANVFIDMEYKMRKDNMKKIGGWFGYKSFKVVRKVPESDQITSFYLKPVDGSALPPFKSGQYLSFNFPRGLIPDVDYDTVRNYSVSCGESNDFFRISAKRELGSTNTHGLVSNYLHDHVQVDSELQVGMPCGTFVLKDDSKPIVLIGGGVGLTPMVSMMETLSLNKTANKVAYIHCSKGADDHAHAHNIDKIAKENDNINAHAFYSRPGESKIKELNLDDTTIHQGRLTMKDLSKIVPSPIEHNQFYMCGPEPFLQAALGMLEELKVPKNQISYEYFGPQLQ